MPALLFMLLPLLPQLAVAIPGAVSGIKGIIDAIRAHPETPEDIKALLDQDDADLDAVLARVAAYKPIDTSA